MCWFTLCMLCEHHFQKKSQLVSFTRWFHSQWIFKLLYSNSKWPSQWCLIWDFKKIDPRILNWRCCLTCLTRWAYLRIEKKKLCTVGSSKRRLTKKIVIRTVYVFFENQNFLKFLQLWTQISKTVQKYVVCNNFDIASHKF